MRNIIINDVELYEIEGLIKQGYELKISYIDGEDSTETLKIGFIELVNHKTKDKEVYRCNTIDFDVFTGNITYSKAEV